MATLYYSRRAFLGGVATVGAGLLLPQPLRSQSPDKPPRLDLDQVQNIVGVSHSDLDAVTELVEFEPRLVNACHDWGGGDFETALGAASHMGRQDIARYLLDHGARINIFCATMLGELEIVRAFLTFDSGLVEVKGPHGLSLMHHARKGESEEVIALLASFGAVTN